MVGPNNQKNPLSSQCNVVQQFTASRHITTLAQMTGYQNTIAVAVDRSWTVGKPLHRMRFLLATAVPAGTAESAY